MPWRDLTPDEEHVIVGKGTERAFTGKYYAHKGDGVYRCKRCNTPLFASDAKFDSGTGWPSFDRALPGAVKEVADADGMRSEIVCARCGGHLGHVFRGEGFTAEQTRHCVNSVSLDFEPQQPPAERDGVAYFAGGCFWGVEHFLEKLPGVRSVVSGYMGGHLRDPSYRQVTGGRTGHAETVKVEFDPTKTSYQALAKRFFEIHDPTQVDRQGPDMGPQYRSAIFVTGEAQRRDVEGLIERLRERGYQVATEVAPAGEFWPAEDYHQDYYSRTGKRPYCHAPVDRFGD